MAFKMKGWSPFNQFVGSDEKDIVSELEEEQSKEKQWIEKSKEASDVLATRKKTSDVIGSIDFSKIQEITNVPQDRIQNIIDDLKSQGMKPSTQDIISILKQRKK